MGLKIFNTQLKICSILLISSHCLADDGKLLGTSGLIQLEGSGGGGIVPWSTIAGYESRDGNSLSVFNTNVSLDNFRLNSTGISWGFHDSFEFSVAQQTLDLTDIGGEIRQNILGIKKHLYGDLVYSAYPQVSIGLQYKTLLDKTIAEALEAHDTSGVDVYLSATKAHLGAVAGYNLVWDVTVRATKSNQLGLLGFGHVSDNDFELMFEGSLGLFLAKDLAVGIEFRQKPDNLALKEDDWQDVFISYFPSKNLSLTFAYANAGEIAGFKNQDGVYFSIAGSF